MKMLNDRRGVSPVITTVIIVAVGITIAIAVALWMTGLVGAFMGYEKVEIRSAFPEPQTGGGWKIYISYLNTGSSPAKIDGVFVNNIPYNSWSGTGWALSWTEEGGSAQSSLPANANIGKKVDLVLTIPDGATYGNQKLVSGVTVEIKLHSTGGKEYFTSVVLP
jgi:FlaG/FlaF family flagellin (archaellin)